MHGVTDLAGESKHIYIALPESPEILPLTISNFQCNFYKNIIILFTHSLFTWHHKIWWANLQNSPLTCFKLFYLKLYFVQFIMCDTETLLLMNITTNLVNFASYKLNKRSKRFCQILEISLVLTVPSFQNLRSFHYLHIQRPTVRTLLWKCLFLALHTYSTVFNLGDWSKLIRELYEKRFEVSWFYFSLWSFMTTTTIDNCDLFTEIYIRHVSINNYEHGIEITYWEFVLEFIK